MKQASAAITPIRILAIFVVILVIASPNPSQGSSVTSQASNGKSDGPVLSEGFYLKPPETGGSGKREGGGLKQGAVSSPFVFFLFCVTKNKGIPAVLTFGR